MMNYFIILKLNCYGNSKTGLDVQVECVFVLFLNENSIYITGKHHHTDEHIELYL